MIKYLSRTPSKLFGDTALVRLDFNTKDDWRMRASLLTIRLALSRAKKVVILSHYGRPDAVSAQKAMRGGFQKEFSLGPHVKILEKMLRKKIVFVPHFDFIRIKKAIEAAPRGSIFVLENLRFLKGEKENSAALAKTLASLGDFFVNDCFAVSHRANASFVAITKFLPSYAGIDLEKEMVLLSRVMQHPKHPLVIILGGAKATDKLGVIRRFRKKADSFLLGGGSANTILALRGVAVQNSVRDVDPKDLAVLKAVAGYKNVIVPSEVVWHQKAIVDIGRSAILDFASRIKKARTIFWSGPLGLIEKPKFSAGTAAVARAIVKNTKTFSVAGGGETVMFLKKHRLDKKIGFISTGGGALMDFLAGEKLPGIEALK